MNEGLLLSFVVCCWLEDFENILKLLPIWQYEEDISAFSSQLEQTIKVHLPMIKNSFRSRLLELCPLDYAISQSLRFDSLVGGEFNVECSKLDCPLVYASHSITIV